ncbi:MAG: hypothetical protein ABSF44_06375 [Candidatus Bathyarchaeia archaeon]|jgi:hypothetical protein
MANPSQKANQFNKKNKLIIAALAIVAVLLASFWVTQQISFWPSNAVKPDVTAVPPITGYYLNFQGNTTKIFVGSATVSSGSYPYPTRSALGSKSGSPPVVEKGEPCVIINVTIRNDYSEQSPVPDHFPGHPTLAYVFLTAKIFNGDKQINSVDLTHVGLPPDAWSLAGLQGGENETISIYLATTSRTEITGFEIVPMLIGGLP